MQALPHTLYRAQDTQALDRIAIGQFGIPGIVLMERAGAAAFDLLRKRWPRARQVAVLCGGGNNGGDGFVLARLAHSRGLAVHVYLTADPQRLRAEALEAWRAMLHEGVAAEQALPASLAACDVIVDALLGTGLRDEVRDPYRHAIGLINAAQRPVLALDIPSGLSADTGAVLGAAVRAEATLTFIGLKQGLLTGAGPSHCGELHFDALQVPAGVYEQVPPAARRIDHSSLAFLLPPRPRSAHKGEHGHVLVIGGDHGMGGAARLAGEAALRAGAGLVSVATRAAHAPLLSSQRPELMCHGVETAEDLEPLLRRATVIAIGPGLGRGAWGQIMFRRALALKTPLVLDADALNLLADQPLRRERWILTPHPGEAARLLDCEGHDIQQDRFAAAQGLQERYGGVIVLKGAGTLVCAPGADIGVCSEGNPGMGSGGMGDVLTGVIAALAAQGLPLADAARLGVCLHAAAADRAARDGERGMIAGDLMPHLRHLANPR